MNKPNYFLLHTCPASPTTHTPLDGWGKEVMGMSGSLNTKLEDIGKRVFGEKFEKIKSWCIERKEPDKFHAIPKGKVANVFVIIEPLSRMIIRHEQETTDLTTIPTPLGYSVPAILNTKFQSGAVRRQMLALLHEWFDRNGSKYLSELKKTGYTRDNYTCTMRPYMRQEREKQAPEGFEGYCGECPNCLIFGYAVQEGAGYNVKSRVEGDIYVAVVPEEKAAVTVTFNAVDDITKTTMMPGTETGALYEFRMVEVGIPFVGKLALKDMTFAELLLTLIAIARTSRIGGRVTHFGEIKIHIPAILFSNYELGSGYEMAIRILGKYKGKIPTLEEVMNEIAEYVNKFKDQGILVPDRELGDKLRHMKREDVNTVILQAWKDVLVLKRSLDLYVGKK